MESSTSSTLGYASDECMTDCDGADWRLPDELISDECMIDFEVGFAFDQRDL